MGFLQNLFNGPFGAIYGLLVIVCVVHLFVRRNDLFWLAILFFIPYIGAIAYFITQVLPELRGARVLEAVESFKPVGMRVKDLERQLEELPTAQNRILLALAYRDAGQLEKAEELLSETRQGVFRNDPHVTYDLADVKFRGGKLKEAKLLLRELLEAAPEELRGRGRLLLARTLEALGNSDEAETLYQSAISSFSGEEARYFFAAFLNAQGKRDEAVKQVAALERNVKRASNQYRYAQREWLERARKLS